MDGSILFSVFLVGLATAMLLFMISSGLTLVFGVLGIINFAHGSLYMLGAYLGLSFLPAFSRMAGSFWIALILSSVVVAVLGGAIEILFLRRVYKADHIYQLLLTYALVMIIDALVKMLWGLDPMSISAPPWLSGSFRVMGRPFPVYSAFIIMVGLVISIFLWFFIIKSRFGKFIRAAASDVDMTNALGINVPFIFTGVFMLGSWLAAVGGFLTGPLRVTSPEMGILIIIECFAIVVIGGMGSLQGAFIGSLLLGMVTSFGAYFVPRLSMVFVYLLMAAILIAKPTGMFGSRE
jgi:branched-subunit amino acid ABC-type transport system permease component